MAATSVPALLFLDFDGVLHPGSGAPGDVFGQAPALEAALAPWRCDSVISSSWRFHAPVQAILQQLPQGLSRRVVSCTGPAHVGRWPRYHEIRAWLDINGGRASWRALDDAAFEFPDACPQLIRCNPRTGFGAREAQAVHAWLGGMAG